MSDDISLYNKAVEFVIIAQKASTSFIQRKLQIGYNAAASLIDQMEANGIVSPANHVGKRDVLVSSTDKSPAPFTGEVDAKQTEGAKPVKPKPSGPQIKFTCSGCDFTDQGFENGLPEGWYIQTSARLGQIPRCPKCSLENAVKITTSTMTTQEILNAGNDGADTDAVTSAAQTRLKTYVQRFDNLFTEIANISDDVSELRKDCKNEGYDVKILIKVVREARKNQTQRKEEQEIFDLYASAVGLD